MAKPLRRQRQAPWLAIIVISLLVIMGLIAFVERDGSTVAEDSGVRMGVDAGEEAPVNPNPDPGAPIPDESPADRL